MRFIFVFLFLILSLSVAAEVTKVKLLTEKSYLPYSYFEGTELKGLYVDILKRLFQEMPEYQLELKGVNWNKAKRMVKNGEALGLVGAYYHGHDWPYLYPYSQPLAHEEVIVVCNNKHKASQRPVWPQDYKGLLVANVAGYDGWLDNNVRSLENTRYANFIEVPNTAIALTMAIKGRIDCALFETAALGHTLQFLQTSGIYKPDQETAPFVSTQLSREPAYIGYSKPALASGRFPYAQDLIRKIDNQLYLLRKSGELQKIKNKYKSTENQ